jgi:hypothetical protein
MFSSHLQPDQNWPFQSHNGILTFSLIDPKPDIDPDRIIGSLLVLSRYLVAAECSMIQLDANFGISRKKWVGGTDQTARESLAASSSQPPRIASTEKLDDRYIILACDWYRHHCISLYFSHE